MYWISVYGRSNLFFAGFPLNRATQALKSNKRWYYCCHVSYQRDYTFSERKRTDYHSEFWIKVYLKSIQTDHFLFIQFKRDFSAFTKNGLHNDRDLCLTPTVLKSDDIFKKSFIFTSPSTFIIKASSIYQGMV